MILPTGKICRAIPKPPKRVRSETFQLAHEEAKELAKATATETHTKYLGMSHRSVLESHQKTGENWSLIAQTVSHFGEIKFTLPKTNIT